MSLRHTSLRQRERQRLATARRLWRAVEEFSPAGWGHEQLSGLALLAANVGDEPPLPWRALERLARQTAAARLAALDRLADIALELARCGRREEAGRLEGLVARIDRALAGVSTEIGHGGPVAEPAGELASACREMLVSVAEVRSSLVGRVAVDLVPLLRWLIGERFAAPADTAVLTVDLDGVAKGDEPCVVLAGVLDLADGLSGALEVLLRCPRRRVASASLSVHEAPDSVVVRLDWQDRRADPGPAVLWSLLPLEAYGAAVQRIGPRGDLSGGVTADLRLASSGARREPVRLAPTRIAKAFLQGPG
jgi:hypothetical protein